MTRGARVRRERLHGTAAAALVLLASLGRGQQEAAPVAPAPPEPPPPVAFVGVTVVPMDGGPQVRPDHTVLVREGRIAALGPRDEVAVPDDVRVIDGAGRWLTPGLVDAHVHTWDPLEQVLFLANGVTTVRNMFGAPQHVQWREEAASAKRLAPTILTAGPIVDGDPPVWPGSRVLTSPADAAAVVREHQEGRYDFVKVYQRLPREAYLALVEAAHAAGMPVDGHVPSAVGLDAALAAGQRTIEHLDGFAEALAAREQPAEATDGAPANPSGFLQSLLLWQRLDPARLPQLAARVREAGTWICPTLIVMNKWLDEDEARAERERPAAAYVSPQTLGFWRGMLAGLPAELRAAGRASHAGRVAATHALHEAGARLLLGTDAGNPWVIAGFSVHEELSLLVEAGLSPHDALFAATRAPAECFGLVHEFGSIAVGLRADLLLLEADPLADLAHLQRRAGVMLRGQWLEESTLAELLETAATANRVASPAPDRDDG